MKNLASTLFIAFLFIGMTTVKAQDVKTKSRTATIKAPKATNNNTAAPNKAATLIDPADADAQKPAKVNTTTTKKASTNSSAKVSTIKKANAKSVKVKPTLTEPK